MRKKRAYLVGIKGVAMTSMAIYLQEKGFEVSGSDVPDEFLTDKILNSHGIKVKKGFTAENIDTKFDVVLVTGAHGGITNPEAEKAVKLGIPTYMHGKYLGEIMKGKFGISIAGCHGKTTTSSLTAFMLNFGGFKPSYAIGTAEINGLGAAGHFGSGNIFVAEADEYMTCPQTDPTQRFLWQDPKIAVVTNIEFDHPDTYADISKVKEAFLKFINKLGEDASVVACIDNENVAAILPYIKRQVITYGFSPRADFRITRFHFDEGLSFMRVQHKNMDLGEFMLQIPGKHNLTNALAGIIVAQHLGMSRENIKKALKLYSGCKRRFEKVGETDNILFYDDYAHHPTEIMATLVGAKQWFNTRRIIAIFQPHTFSRTKALLSEFGKSFQSADIAIICDIYPSAREKADPTISSNLLVLEINKLKNNAYYLKDKDQIESFLVKNVKSGDLILTIGAGDIYLWQDIFIKRLKDRL